MGEAKPRNPSMSATVRGRERGGSSLISAAATVVFFMIVFAVIVVVTTGISRGASCAATIAREGAMFDPARAASRGCDLPSELSLLRATTGYPSVGSEIVVAECASRARRRVIEAVVAKFGTEVATGTFSMSVPALGDVVATTLHACAANGRRECCEGLLLAGADVEALDSKGRTSFDVAASDDVADLFVEWEEQQRRRGGVAHAEGIERVMSQTKEETTVKF